MAVTLSDDVSLKLDALRFLAAISVVCAHASQLAYTGPHQGELIAFGRMGVVVFFLLSGFVIAYVCDAKHRGWRDYLVARLARLHSVFLAALLLTAAADSLGRSMAPGVYAGTGAAPGLSNLVGAPFFVSFLHESFAGSLRWLSNGPLWSIAYEFWYYILFGCAYYLRGNTRIAALVFFSLVAGPRVLVLLPLWLLGVGMYHLRGRLEALPKAMVAGSFLAGLTGILFLCQYSAWADLAPVREWGSLVIGRNYSAFFAWDLLLALPASLLLTGIIRPGILQVPVALNAGVRYLAGSTFTIYCCHVPLLLLVRATGTYDSSSASAAGVAVLLVLGMCFLVSVWTERRKGPWTRFWAKIVGS